MNNRLWLMLGGVATALGLGLWLLHPGRTKPALAPTTERDGVGPVTLRRYWLDVQEASQPPEMVVKAVLDHFPEHMPKPLAMTFKIRGKRGVGRVGDRYFILMLVRRGFIETEVVEPLRFRNRTLRLHPESGWVELKAIPSEADRGYSYRLQVQSSVRTSTRADRLAYLLGMSGLQARTWESVLEHALALSGGNERQRGRDTGEFDHVPGGVRPPKTVSTGLPANVDHLDDQPHP